MFVHTSRTTQRHIADTMVTLMMPLRYDTLKAMLPILIHIAIEATQG